MRSITAKNGRYTDYGLRSGIVQRHYDPISKNLVKLYREDNKYHVELFKRGSKKPDLTESFDTSAPAQKLFTEYKKIGKIHGRLYGYG